MGGRPLTPAPGHALLASSSRVSSPLHNLGLRRCPANVVRTNGTAKKSGAGAEGSPEYSREHVNWAVTSHKKRCWGGGTHLPQIIIRFLVVLTNTAGRRKQPVAGTRGDFWGCSQVSPHLASHSLDATTEVGPCSRPGNLLPFHAGHPTQGVFLSKLPFL